MNRDTELELESFVCRPRGEPVTTTPWLDPEAEHAGLDQWALADAIWRNWPWLLVAGALLAGLGGWVGAKIWNTAYTVSAQLVRHDSPYLDEVGGERLISPQTFASVLRSPELLERVAQKAVPPVRSSELAATLRLTPELDSEILHIALEGDQLNASVDLANLYAQEAVQHTKQIQAAYAAELNRFVTEQLARMDVEIQAVNDQMHALPQSVALAAAAPRADPVLEKIRSAREELLNLLPNYTDEHPLVQAQRAKLATFEGQLAERVSMPASSLTAGALPPDTKATNELATLLSQLQRLESARHALAAQKRAAETLENNPPGYYKLLAPATTERVAEHRPEVKIAALSLLGGLVGIAGAALLVLLVEVFDNRLKTTSDIQRVTGLPVLAAAGNLRTLDQAERNRVAFSAWTAVQSRLKKTLNQARICGLTSSSRNEGNSTWTQLLAHAARQRGYRVLTVTMRAAPWPATNGEAKGKPRKSWLRRAQKKVACPSCGQRTPYQTDDPKSWFACGGCASLFSVAELRRNGSPEGGILGSPGEVREKLEHESRPIVHIPLPEGDWAPWKREQWQAALSEWALTENLVILIELPPAGVHESVLLAEQLPNLVWLVDSRKADAGETRAQLTTLRDAGCHLVGAIANRSRSKSLRRRFSRWVAALALLASLHSGSLLAQDIQAGAATAPQSAEGTTNQSFSAVGRPKAGWQQKLTLGAGDLLNFSFFGRPEWTRSAVPIGPDGRVGYLEAQAVLVAGLTIDEVRTTMDSELARYHRSPRTIVTPAAFRSKKYFILGRVAQRGAFVLDRPMTIIEAVANARGFETSLLERQTISPADYSRSFLARGGRRLPVDFERLFQQGDLTQNIVLEPNDYLYFPANETREVYVLGEVRAPGPALHRTGVGSLAAIAMRGGFTDRAWKHRILVIRGSLSNPQSFVVNATEVLTAREPDFMLQPRDIVYVNARPWIRAEELLDAAASAFVEAAVITWTGDTIRLID